MRWTIHLWSMSAPTGGALNHIGRKSILRKSWKMKRTFCSLAKRNLETRFCLEHWRTVWGKEKPKANGGQISFDRLLRKVRDWGKHLWWPITVFLMIWCYNNITKRELMLILKKSPVWVRISWYYLLILFSRSDSNSLRGPKWIWRLQIKNGHCAAHSQGVRPWGYKKNLKRQGFCYATLPTVAQTTQGCPKKSWKRRFSKALTNI